MLSFNTLTDFEKAVSNYTGAPYVVLTDSCTHAMELCLRLAPPIIKVSLPKHTYLSVPMMLYKLGIDFEYNDVTWNYEYQIHPTQVWDSARAFDKDMFIPGRLQCLSFGHTKRLQIGHGGAILVDDEFQYQTLKEMAYDGRDLSINPWQDQPHFRLGFHYNMRLEDAAKGIEMLGAGDLREKITQLVKYPDCSKITIDIPQ